RPHANTQTGIMYGPRTDFSNYLTKKEMPLLTLDAGGRSSAPVLLTRLSHLFVIVLGTMRRTLATDARNVGALTHSLRTFRAIGFRRVWLRVTVLPLHGPHSICTTTHLPTFANFSSIKTRPVLLSCASCRRRGTVRMIWNEYRSGYNRSSINE